MRTGQVLALCLVGAGLGGCTLTSAQPLFALDQAPKHPMRDGLWAMTGPGCEVKPSPAGQPLPECVGETMTIAGGRMTWEIIGSLIGPLPPEQLKQITASLPQGGAFVLVDGDPNIIELVSDPPKTAAPPRPTPVGYMSLRSLEQDSAGRIVRGVLWMTPCPDKPGQPGFKDPATPLPSGGTSVACVAETQDAVRAQAPHMKPFISFFVTWVR
jgi:hypothetical protein